MRLNRLFKSTQLHVNFIQFQSNCKLYHILSMGCVQAKEKPDNMDNVNKQPQPDNKKKPNGTSKNDVYWVVYCSISILGSILLY